MNKRFVDTYNYKLTPARMEPISNLKSETVKDETYTIRQLVERAQQGLYPVTARESVWSENPNIDDYDLEKVHRMDLAEKQEVMEQTRERVQQLQDDLEQHKLNIRAQQERYAKQQEDIQKEKFLLWTKNNSINKQDQKS